MRIVSPWSVSLPMSPDISIPMSVENIDVMQCPHRTDLNGAQPCNCSSRTMSLQEGPVIQVISLCKAELRPLSEYTNAVASYKSSKKQLPLSYDGRWSGAPGQGSPRIRGPQRAIVARWGEGQVFVRGVEIPLLGAGSPPSLRLAGPARNLPHIPPARSFPVQIIPDNGRLCFENEGAIRVDSLNDHV
jgi:hypothetical protein